MFRLRRRRSSGQRRGTDHTRSCWGHRRRCCRRRYRTPRRYRRRPQHVRPSTQSQRASQMGTWNQQYPRRTDLMQIPNPTTADTHRLGIPKLTSPQGGPLGSFTAKPLCPPPPYTPYGATVSQTSHNSRGSGADGSSLASVPQSYQPSSGLHTDLQSYGWHSTGGEVSSYNSRKWTPASVAAPRRSFHPHRG